MKTPQNRLVEPKPENQFATYGLKSDWKISTDWALRNGVSKQLQLVANVTLISDKCAAISNVMSFLREELATLELWSRDNPSAGNLFQLGQAAMLDSEIIDQHFAMGSYSFEVPAVEQLTPIGTFYLLGLILTRIPVSDKVILRKYNKLKLWCFVQALSRGLVGNYQDGYLKIICEQIRIASKRYGEVYDLIPQIITEFDDFEDFSNAIKYNGTTLLTHQKIPTSSTSKFLKALISASEGQHLEIKNIGELIPSFPINPESSAADNVPTQQLVRQHSNTPSEWWELDDDISQVDTFTSDDDESNLSLIAVNKSKSYSQQKLSAGSVYLSTVEQSQYLPCTWQNLSTHELELLNSNIKVLLDSSTLGEKFVAACLWLALQLGRSLRHLLDMDISIETVGDWSLNIIEMKLHRLAPKRKSGWSPSCQNHYSAIIPSVESQDIVIPEDIRSILSESYTNRPTVNQIWQLWDNNWGESPMLIFNKHIKTHIPRITQGMMEFVLPNEIFNSTQDYKFAKLIASSAKTGLPPACAYASYTNIDIAFENNTNQLLLTQFNSYFDPKVEKEVILFGCELYPLEEMLKNEIKLATNKLYEVKSKNQLIEFHNHFTAYLHTMLLAATGARPFTDVFESPQQFDLDQHFIFLDEKSGMMGNRGRVVPLPIKLSRYLKVEYRAHLRLLAAAINKDAPLIADEVGKLADGLGSNRMPYLFLLAPNSPSGWSSISQTNLAKLKLFNWPLPENLFRHRLAKYLPRHGVDSEVLDGILGHMEYGSESYGDFSERIWSEDQKQISNVLEDAFDELGFELISHHPSLVIDYDTSQSLLEPEELLFGKRARANRRKKSLQLSLKVVKEDIKNFLNGRNLGELDANQVKELSNVVVFSSNGLPRKDAFLRYCIFEKMIARHWKETGVKIKLNQRYISPPVNSPFNEYCPNAISTLTEIKSTFQKVLNTTRNKKTSHYEIQLFSALLLILETRLTDLKLILRVFNGTHFRLVSLKGNYYIELGLQEDLSDHRKPVKRLKVSKNAVSFISRIPCKSESKSIDLASELPLIFIPIAKVLESSGKFSVIRSGHDLLQAIVKLMDQENAINLPGIVTAYLAGRVDSFSLGWEDWVKQTTGENIKLPDLGEMQVLKDVDLSSDVLEKTSQPPLDDTLQTSAHKFYKVLRAHLDAYEQQESDFAKSRRDFSRIFDDTINEFRDSVSPSILLLGLWTKNLFLKKKFGKKHELAISTVKRYFSDLSSKFEDLAFSHNLIEMDEDEVTEFYDQLLTCTDPQNRHYTEQRLLEFHEWAMHNYDIEEPDWSELILGGATPKVSPGFISEKEYQQALLLLSKTNKSKSEHQGRLLAFLLMLAYRFGLRSAEALGLNQEDWVQYHDQLVVLVQDNAQRKLKSKMSRRQVPLLFNLSKFEHTLIENHLNHLKSVFANQPSAPLFFIDNKGLDKFQKQTLKRIVILALKQVTGNQTTVIHHARHSFNNKVCISVFDLNIEGWGTRNFKLSNQAHECLLGGKLMTRRSSWATARLLGHATRETQFKNYTHFLGEWSGIFFKSLGEVIAPTTTDGVIMLDHFERKAEIKTDLIEDAQTQYAELTPNTGLKVLRLVVNGKSLESAAAAIHLNLAEVRVLIDFVEEISTTLRALNNVEPKSMALLSKINRSAWPRLFKLTLASETEKTFKESLQLPNILISEVKSLIGSSGHIIVYLDSHFALIKEFIACHGISNDCYRLIKTKSAATQFDEIAKTYGFQLVTELDGKNRTENLRVDPAMDVSNRYRIVGRCAFCFEENAVNPIRNRYELLLLFAVYVASVCQVVPK